MTASDVAVYSGRSKPSWPFLRLSFYNGRVWFVEIHLFGRYVGVAP